MPRVQSFKQFDPVADTETQFATGNLKLIANASNNSIRLRILKQNLAYSTLSIRTCFKQFDPVADTETRTPPFGRTARPRFKQFDPVADTETTSRSAAYLGMLRCFKQFDPVADTETADYHRSNDRYWGFKQFDPVADTETQRQHKLTAHGSQAQKHRYHRGHAKY